MESLAAFRNQISVDFEMFGYSKMKGKSRNCLKCRSNEASVDSHHFILSRRLTVSLTACHELMTNKRNLTGIFRINQMLPSPAHIRVAANVIRTIETGRSTNEQFSADDFALTPSLY
jgi:hypothetical protein